MSAQIQLIRVVKIMLFGALNLIKSIHLHLSKRSGEALPQRRMKDTRIRRRKSMFNVMIRSTITHYTSPGFPKWFSEIILLSGQRRRIHALPQIWHRVLPLAPLQTG